MQYFIRSLKYLVYFGILMTLMLVIVFYTSSHRSVENFWDLIPASNRWFLALFLGGVALIYPLFGFASRKIYLNNSFAQDRELLVDILLRANYEIKKDENNRLSFRHKSPVVRLFRMYEDCITLDYSNNPVQLEGLRRDVYRFARNMEYVIRQSSL
jgi:hypothetical protein